MPVSKERVKEIVEFAALRGVEFALETYGIPQETYNRYQRKYRQVYGDEKSTVLMAKVREKYTDEQLTHLLTMHTSKPDRARSHINFEGQEFCFLGLSDTHIGSTYFEESLLLSALEEGERQNCQAMLHAGDILEGMSGRPGQIYELNRIGYSAQRDYAVELFREWKKPIHFCTGNHTEWANTKAGVGIDIGEDISLRIPDAHYVGAHEGTVNVNGAKFMLWHGEDGSSYATSYRVQKIIESFSGGEKPNVLLCGHSHKQCYIFDRNIHAVSLGSIQKQSGFMRYKRLPAHVGFWIIRGKIRDGQIVQFSPTLYPFYE